MVDNVRRVRTVAIIGAGWAGLSAAVHAIDKGWRVTMYEMSQQCGGRARTVTRPDGQQFDNGQHILIGAYVECLALMRKVGADPDTALLRLPLQLRYPNGDGLVLPAGPAWLAFGWGVLRARGWSWADRLSLIELGVRWASARFRCAASTTVAQLGSDATDRIRRDWLDPLCSAALNTPSATASGQVFLRVLKDALFAGSGASNLLLPRMELGSIFPGPAALWLRGRGAVIHLRSRVQSLEFHSDGVWVSGMKHDAAILACGAQSSARLVESLAPDWSRQASALRHQAIVTVYLDDPTLRLQAPMLALPSHIPGPAQFVFDMGLLSSAKGRFAFVASAASAAVEESLADAVLAVTNQARRVFPGHFGHVSDACAHAAVERRATFACTADLTRPPQRICNAIWAAGDFVDGPYPATLEGAALSGRLAVLGMAAGSS